MGHHDGEFEGIIGGKEDTVEAIGHIKFGQEQGALSGVSMVDQPKEPGQGTPKLHHFTQEVGDSMVIHAKPGVIHQDTRATVVLHLDGHVGKSEIFLQGLDLFQREDDPEPSINEVSEFITEEIMMQDGGRVWALGGTGSNAVGIPRGVIHVDSGTIITEMLQIGSSSVWYILDHGGEVGGSPHIVDEGSPGRHGTQVVRQVSYRCT